MLPPLPRCSSWVSSSLISPRRVSLPRFHCRVGLHIDLFEVCSAFTHVAACTLAQSPYFVTAIRRLQTFRLLHACSGCFRLERSTGWALHPLESAAFSRRTPRAAILRVSNNEEHGIIRETLVSRTMRDLVAGSGLRLEGSMRRAVSPNSSIHVRS